MNNPKFSICICAYNREETIVNCVNSVLCQKYLNYEIILLDNGSTDNTRKIIEDLEKVSDKIKAIYIDNNVGWYHGTSICLEYASGDYMTMLAADDMFYNADCLSIVANELEIKNAQIVFVGNFYVHYKEGQYEFLNATIPKYRYYDDRIDKITCIYEIMSEVYYNSMFHFTQISFLHEHNIDFYKPYTGDCISMTKAIVDADRISVIDKPIYLLTINTSQGKGRVSIINTTARQWEFVIDALLQKGNYDARKLEYIAARILKNGYSQLEGICNEATVTDLEMDEIYLDTKGRIDLINSLISDKYFKMIEMYICDNSLNKEFYQSFRALCKKLSLDVEDYYSINYDIDFIVDRIKMLLEFINHIIRNPERFDYKEILEECEKMNSYIMEITGKAEN